MAAADAKKKIILHGSPFSTCSQRVLCVLAEKEIPFDFNLIDLGKGQHKGAEYLKLQPWGQVPVIDDNGFILYESRAIIRYLEEKFAGQGTALLPKSLQDRALVEQWISVETSNVTTELVKLCFQLVWGPHMGMKTDEAAVEAAVKSSASKLDVVEKLLTGKTYFVAEQFTLADVTPLPYIALLVNTKRKEVVDLFETRPTIWAWFQRVSSRPSWKAATGQKV